MEQSNVLQAGNYRGLTLTVMCRIEMSQCKTPAASDPGSFHVPKFALQSPTLNLHELQCGLS